MRIFYPYLTVSLLVAGVFSSSASAQSRDLQERLENASRVDCSFTQVATGDWGDEAAEFSTEPVEFTASFFDIDVESGTAEAEGRFGASYIIVRHVEGYLHFMQLMNAGPLYLTTILAQPTQDGRLKAVHARHEYTQVRLPGFTSRPEMYLGDCAVE
ncbi:MAG TPA: hypothetical protein VIV64_11895 [Gammaproteobacteria bacterium]|jgi:hypothetical protein